MTDLLTRLSIPNFDAGAYISRLSSNTSSLPNIGIAASGGGLRALTNGAGAIAAFDSRTPNSTSPGHIGGLLQSATYLSGLSGGSWLVGSLYVNNFTSVQEIIDQNGKLWDFETSVVDGPPQGTPVLSNIDYWSQIGKAVDGKNDARFDTTLTDYWGRGLSYQLVNVSDGGPAYTWSSLADQSFFSDGQAPLPILVADERAPGQLLLSGNTTVFEFNPW